MKKRPLFEKSVGHFEVLKKPTKVKWDFFKQSIEDSNQWLPIVNVKINRAFIYNILWNTWADSVAYRFLSPAEYQDYSRFEWIIVEEKVEALTEILAYLFSKRKPAGIGSKSKDSRRSKKDITLSMLRKYSKKSQPIVISEDIKEFYPLIETDVSLLKTFLSINGELSPEFVMQKNTIINKILDLSKREEHFISRVVQAVETLKASFGEGKGYSEQEIRALVQGAQDYFSYHHQCEFNISYKSFRRLVLQYIDVFELNENGDIVRRKKNSNARNKKRIIRLRGF